MNNALNSVITNNRSVVDGHAVLAHTIKADTTRVELLKMASKYTLKHRGGTLKMLKGIIDKQI